MRKLRRALLWLAIASACGHASVQGPAVARSASTSADDAAVRTPATGLETGAGSGAVPTDPAPLAQPAPEPRVAAPSAFAFEPEIAGAVARIERRAMERDLASIVGERHDLTARPHLEAVTKMVEMELARAGFTVRRQTVRHGARVSDNVIADRPGSDPSRVVVVAAHLDSVPGSPGADDDASGLAGLLAVARAVSSVPTRAGIRLAAFAFEEDGLVGASQHVMGLSEPERARIAGVLAMDMIGYRDPRPGSQRYPAGIERIVRQPLPDAGDFMVALGLEGEPILPAMEHAQQYVPELRVGTVPVRRWALVAAPDLLRADHAPFWLAGVPAVMVGDTGNFRNPHYHMPTDRLDTLDTQFATLSARWVCASALTLAGVQ